MSAEQAPEQIDKLIGEVLANRYQIEEKLGEGAMGAVYRAKHVKVGRAFAVKLLHAKLLEDRKVALRFEREAELAGRLRHPNVVGVVDVGETSEGQRYMVMDFAEGNDLAVILNEAPMPPERITSLVRQMLEGLYHAHEAGLIHRDFKPENVIVEKDDHGVEVPRIVDFGIAILRDGGDSTSTSGRLTTNGLVLGTPHYMAPEQAVADPIDHRIDLFALGIVVYEMLSGKLPFDGTGAEVARANLLLDPPMIAQRVPYLEVDPLLEAFARRLMAKKRDHRPPTAKAARELLDLIDKDRTAAAAALGVRVDTGRAPQVTQDVSPHRRANEDTSAEVMHIPVRATDLEAPPVRGEFPTSTAAPLPWSSNVDEEEPRSRRGWIIGGVAALLAAAAIVLIATRGADDKPNQPDEQKVVIKATDPMPPPRPVEVKPVDPPPIAVAEPRVEPKATGTKPQKVQPKTVAKVETKPAEVAKPEVKPEVVKPVELKPGEKLVDNALWARYTKAGETIKALGDKGNDLWPKYRRINLNNAMTSPEKALEARQILAELEATLASRSK
jgi:serine/threonine protein kinase